MLVSFIVPVLNGEKYISSCLKSIQNQNISGTDYEIIVIDNGSTDKTDTIIRELGLEAQLRPGLRVGALRNYGAKSGNGEFLAFVDADVEIRPNWLRHGLAALEDTSVGAVGCFPRAPYPATWVQQAWQVHQCAKQDAAPRTAVPWLPSMNLIVRRSIFEKVQGFNEELITAEDADLCYRIGRYGTIVSVAAMEAVHWGEAANLKEFWRKETWRGTGHLSGITSHGLRWDELPSLGYPSYMLFLLALVIGCVVTYGRHGHLELILAGIVAMIVPAAVLATKKSMATRDFRNLLSLTLLYTIYGGARAYALGKDCVRAISGHSMSA